MPLVRLVDQLINTCVTSGDVTVYGVLSV